ncbi:MAG: hypothetical protein PGN13_01275 [Patulibacter minatonensis]
MTVIQVRTSPSDPLVGSDLVLDWFPADRAASTINVADSFLNDLAIDPTARELFTLAAAVYCADKVVHRASQLDHWTRTMEFVMRVGDVARWEAARTVLEPMLTFLSGDQIKLRFTSVESPDDAVDLGGESAVLEADAVCLFSGGLDSLTGATDLLSGGSRLVLVGHHDSPLAETKQEVLAPRLADHFGEDAVRRRPLYLRPAVPNSKNQAQPIDATDPETTTRTRSFLFVAAAIAIASAVGPGTPVYMPENGFIGVNVPLTPSRSGSLSTRTTHPLYVDYFHRALDCLGIPHRIENPFRLQTKGELIESCTDRALLQDLAPLTVSCSHPEAARWHQGKQGNCGSCYPCLIRRASLHRVGWDDPNDYDVDALNDGRLLLRHWTSGASLRALLKSLSQPTKRSDVVLNGRIPNGEQPAFYDMWLRGRAELRDWLDAGGSAEVRRRYA